MVRHKRYIFGSTDKELKRISGIMRKVSKGKKLTKSDLKILKAYKALEWH